MATKGKNVSKRGASRTVEVPVENGWRSRVTQPVITDPKQRAKSIKRAATRIKTTTQIDTISLGRD